MHPQKPVIAPSALRLGLVGGMLLCLLGCAAMIQDVHLYYQQMAINYKEAEEKTKLDIVALERDSSSLLQAGDLHKFKRSQRELARLKNWQEYCARQQERFQKAADKTAKAGAATKDAIQAIDANQEGPATSQ